VSNTDIEAHDLNPPDPSKPIERLLSLADVAVPQVEELPLQARALIDSATGFSFSRPASPTGLPGSPLRSTSPGHAADERLDTVLGHMHSVGARANGATGDNSTLSALADAVAQFKRDHILIALRSWPTTLGHELRCRRVEPLRNMTKGDTMLAEESLKMPSDPSLPLQEPDPSGQTDTPLSEPGPAHASDEPLEEPDTPPQKPTILGPS
jgi:hypothetical protein